MMLMEIMEIMKIMEKMLNSKRAKIIPYLEVYRVKIGNSYKFDSKKYFGYIH